jgi:hypothetical protein
VFLVLNLVLTVVVLIGLKQVFLWQHGAKAFSYLLAGAGLFAFSIHGYFLLQGGTEFRLPISLVLLVATLLLSSAQWVVLVGRSD